jgi:hypothetical protein
MMPMNNDGTGVWAQEHAEQMIREDERAKTIKACREALRSCTYDGGSGGMISVREADEAIKGVSNE